MGDFEVTFASELTQAVAAAVVCAVLAALVRRYRRAYLRSWLVSWSALAVHEVTGVFALRLAFSGSPIGEARTALSLASQCAGYLHVGCLILGAWQLAADRAGSARQRALVVVGSLAAGILATLAFAFDPAARLERLFARVGLISLVQCAAFLTTAVLVVRSGATARARGVTPGFGRRLFAAVLGVFALEKLATFALVATELSLERVFPEEVLLGFTEVVLETSVGLGLVAWFYGEESDRARLAIERSEEAESRFRTMADAAPILMWGAEPSGERTFFNRRWLELVGASLEDELRSGWLRHVHAADVDRCRDAWEEAVGSSGPHQIEYRLVRRDGEVRWILEASVPRFDGAGRLVGFLGSCIDVDARKRMEDKIVHGRNLESLGRLAGGIAHDFNNLLTAILGYADGLLDARAGDEVVESHVRPILRAGDRASQLTRQLLTFARREEFSAVPVDLRESVRGLCELLERLIGSDVQLDESIVDEPVVAEIDPTHLERLVFNLVINAREAMPNGGRLTLAVRHRAIRAGDRVPELSPGRYAELEVRDEGVGMDDGTRARAFEPFFTTKSEGSGLGLATCYGIARQNGGAIEIESEPGRGTLVRVLLPASDAEPRSPDAQSAELADVVGAECVLVVEDEEPIRRLMVDTLRRLGYRVIAARDGEEGLRLGRDGGASVDLAILDAILPRLSGVELAERLREGAPALRVLFVSGSAARVQSIEENGDGRAFLAKPFTLREMAVRVRELLDA